MIEQATIRLKEILEEIPARIRAISEEEFVYRPHPNKWSKKEILGHLIDSAANNHQRFVRTQYENLPHIVYDQENWIRIQKYIDLPPEEVISLWEMLNKHLLYIISVIPKENYNRLCHIGGATPVTLEWLVVDYVKHMEHHLKQII